MAAPNFISDLNLEEFGIKINKVIKSVVELNVMVGGNPEQLKESFLIAIDN